MNLDNKLRQIIKGWHSGVGDENADKAIAQIKQAFADKGYLQIQSEVGMDTFFTGKQWYDRFEKEIEDLRDSDWGGDYVNAAKKASGL